MLVLSRKQDQSLMIGDDVKITVLEVKGNQVRLGISAPTSITVHREEIHNKLSSDSVE
jgi:carbon storage regulator